MSRIKKTEGRIVVKPGSDIVASMAPDFKKELQALVDEDPAILVIDLAGVKMVDSIGIGVIIAAHNSIKRKHGQLEVINTSKDIYQVFTAMRLNHHFHVGSAG